MSVFILCNSSTAHLYEWNKVSVSWNSALFASIFSSLPITHKLPVARTAFTIGASARISSFVAFKISSLSCCIMPTSTPDRYADRPRLPFVEGGYGIHIADGADDILRHVTVIYVEMLQILHNPS